jgi:hypothetical protein
LLNLLLQTAQVFERAFREDGEFLGLAGQKFPPQRNQCSFMRYNCSTAWIRMASRLFIVPHEVNRRR